VAAGTLWRLRRPNGPANLRLKRGYAASNSKTDIELSIFPKSYASCIPRKTLNSIASRQLLLAQAALWKRNVARYHLVGEAR